MEIGEEKAAGALVIAPVGRVDSLSSGELERHVVARLDAGERRVVIDMAGVEYISSAGLRVLLLAAKRLKPPAGALVLCGLGPSVRTVLELAGFMGLFVVEPARVQALARIEALPRREHPPPPRAAAPRRGLPPRGARRGRGARALVEGRRGAGRPLPVAAARAPGAAPRQLVPREPGLAQH